MTTAGEIPKLSFPLLLWLERRKRGALNSFYGDHVVLIDCRFCTDEQSLPSWTTDIKSRWFSHQSKYFWGSSNLHALWIAYFSQVLIVFLSKTLYDCSKCASFHSLLLAGKDLKALFKANLYSLINCVDSLALLHDEFERSNKAGEFAVIKQIGNQVIAFLTLQASLHKASEAWVIVLKQFRLRGRNKNGYLDLGCSCESGERVQGCPIP